jgi:hypothetical protein
LGKESGRKRSDVFEDIGSLVFRYQSLQPPLKFPERKFIIYDDNSIHYIGLKEACKLHEVFYMDISGKTDTAKKTGTQQNYFQDRLHKLKTQLRKYQVQLKYCGRKYIVYKSISNTYIEH